MCETEGNLSMTADRVLSCEGEGNTRVKYFTRAGFAVPMATNLGFAWGGGPRGWKAEDVSSLLFTLLFPCKGSSQGSFCPDLATFCPDLATFYPDRGTRGVQKRGAKNGGGLMP